ncbi:hypothetical protein [Alkalicoccobacillus plakortidis]|uniref:DUF4179 domain-containing protein n=1 Tax=Alkalicoccobacillus plakortidis TaxID=444060 RepID=A0ABT0XNY7_9BACI|nr:hypothetical protein [Alkalicoccobacillus plakortidis]MCM2676977.1 hypothetical protein [Alkalicoccobacillus plakortidis]
MKLSNKFKRDFDKVPIPHAKMNEIIQEFNPTSKPRKRSPLILAASILVIVLSISFITHTLQQNRLASDQEITVFSSAGDYATFSRIDELIKMSDLIVRGTVSAAETKTIDISTNSEEIAMMPYVVSTITITDQYKSNDRPINQEEILVKQTINDVASGIHMSTADESALEIGNEYILFLSTFDDDTPASLINPSQGLYIVQNEELTGLGMYHIDTTIEEIQEMINEQKTR